MTQVSGTVVVPTSQKMPKFVQVPVSWTDLSRTAGEGLAEISSADCRRMPKTAPHPLSGLRKIGMSPLLVSYGLGVDTASSVAPESRMMRRVVIASSLGNALEIYDFTVYSFFAVIIGKLFFPGESAIASLLMSLSNL